MGCVGRVDRRCGPTLIEVLIASRCCYILRIHMTSPIFGERISAITLTHQRKQWLSA